VDQDEITQIKVPVTHAWEVVLAPSFARPDGRVDLGFITLTWSETLAADQTSTRNEDDDTPEETLLAIDLGLRCGLALYGGDGRLRWYRSSHFANRAQLKKAIYGILRPIDGLSMVLMEGDRELATFWRKLADKWEIPCKTIGAEVWREQLLLKREQTSGQVAKETADQMARAVISWSDLPSPTSLRHDAAEAILIGLHGVIEQGWLEDVPDAVAR